MTTINPLNGAIKEGTPISRRERHPETQRPVWWILLTGALLRVVFFLASPNAGGDALDRAALAEKWAQHPTLSTVVFKGGWLPLHIWLEGSFALLWKNAESASRLLSLFAGVASLWLVWKIARTIYGEAAAFLSLAVFALYSLHIGYSTTSASESSCVFFALAGLAFFFAFQQTHKLRLVALSGICLGFSAAIRYEAWIIIFGTGLASIGPPLSILRPEFWRAKRLSALGIFALTGGATPAFFMAYSWLKWGHPLYAIALNKSRVVQTLSAFPQSHSYQWAFMPGVLFLTLSPLALAGAVYAVWSTIRYQAGRSLAVVIASLTVVQLYEIVSGGQLTLARYSIFLGTLLAIASGYGLEQIARRFPPRYLRTSRSVVIAVLVLNLGTILALSEAQWQFSDKFASISPRLRFTRHVQSIGSELARRLGSNDAVVIDNYNVESNQVAAIAGLPLAGSPRVLDASVERSDLRGDLQKFMETERPKYVVYSDKGALRPWLRLAGGCPAVPVISGGMSFQCRYANDIYTLYEVGYSTKTSPEHGEEIARGSGNE
jgi:Dolichyl-phosphate-mannose-protein mannosyltransferase